MYLSDQDITFFRRNELLDIAPFHEGQVQPSSYDLRLGNLATGIHLGEPLVNQPFDRIYIGQGDFVLLHTEEVVSLSPSVAGEVKGKSSQARKGLIVESAGLVDPGFSGQLVLEVTNLSPVPVILVPGDLIAQIVFIQLRTPCLKPYGPDRGSHYQGQTGATPAWN